MTIFKKLKWVYIFFFLRNTALLPGTVFLRSNLMLQFSKQLVHLLPTWGRSKLVSHDGRDKKKCYNNFSVFSCTLEHTTRILDAMHNGQFYQIFYVAVDHRTVVVALCRKVRNY